MSSLSTFSAAQGGLARYKQSLNSSTVGLWLGTNGVAPTGGGMGLRRALQLSTASKASPVSQGEGTALPACDDRPGTSEGRENQTAPAAPGGPSLSFPSRQQEGHGSPVRSNCAYPPGGKE